MKHLCLFLLLLLPMLVRAQDDEYYRKNPAQKPLKRTYIVTLKDGTTLRGELMSQDSTGAVIRTRNLGEVRIPAGQIITIEQPAERATRTTTDSTRQRTAEPGINLFPQTMRYAPTAFTAEKQNVYFRNYGLYVSQFEYGITDNWSVSASFFSVLPTAAFSLNTKVSIPVGERVRVGATAQYAAVRTNGLFNGGVGLYDGITYVQGLVTTGDRQSNTTYGLGWTVAGGEISRNLLATFGLVRRLNSRLTFISENFVLLGSGVSRSTNFAGMLSGGFRIPRRRFAFDVALYAPIIFARNDRPLFFLAPFVSYHLRITK